MATQSSSQSPWTALLWEDRLNNSCVSHNEPVLCCQYKKSFWQVVSCSEGSAIKVWDLQNGQLVTEVYEVHGHAAVTCMALDTSGKRLITGGRDGSLKKWDCSTIRYIHTLKQGSGITNSLSTGSNFCVEKYKEHTLICSPFQQAFQMMKSPLAHMLIFTATGTEGMGCWENQLFHAPYGNKLFCSVGGFP
ncbi:U3 small nucleolar RNA-associated protein 15 homolog isoform X1 [Chelonia mydas]|uniref:U3 small nucleolar RNA-associated protein 15 homolog isoform X1 n=1 Tax=Chelonia mydas TaxID=8469 RepID=UPI001CA7DAC9|nr:U3 small nucleolar RNA-associated protein 15 homolog isoform X1 [Chelonia mydas]